MPNVEKDRDDEARDADHGEIFSISYSFNTKVRLEWAIIYYYLTGNIKLPVMMIEITM